jgi:drug/metabolite transporter (DMT)-like permease
MVVCGGLPFLLLVLTGARLAPVAHLGVMLSGAMPLFTAALAVLVLAQGVSLIRATGLLLILCGVVTLGTGSLATQGSQTWLGDLLFLLASLVWAVYGLAFRSTGLTSWEGVAVVSAWSAIIVVPLALATGFGSLPSAPVTDLLTQVIVQGFLAGLLGTVLYNYSIKQLGAQAGTSFSALTPVLSALGGAAFLAERLSFTGIVAVTLTSLGVFLASGIALSRRA